jgi:hypothetical protein
MNASASSSSASSASRAEPSKAPSERGRREADDFARLLRDKGLPQERDASEGPPGGDPFALLAPPSHAPAAAAPITTAAQAAPAAATTAPSLHAGVEAIAALEARMDLLEAPADPTAPRTFEVSMNDRAAIPMSLQVVQPADPSGRWALSVSAPQLNQEFLRRHAGRLDERLRAKGVFSDAVEIEPGEEQPAVGARPR